MAALFALLVLVVLLLRRPSCFSLSAGAVSSLGSGEEQHSRSGLGLLCIAPPVRSVEETPEPIETTVRGNIPAWINGNLLRNGPGKFEEQGECACGEGRPSATPEGAKVLCSIPSVDRARPSYYHSFAMSQNYVVFIEQPLKMDLLKIVTSKLRGKPINDGIYWDPNLETVFHMISKHTGKVSLALSCHPNSRITLQTEESLSLVGQRATSFYQRGWQAKLVDGSRPVSAKYYVKAMADFHQINAFEQDDFLLLDLLGSDDGEAVNDYLIQNILQIRRVLGPGKAQTHNHIHDVNAYPLFSLCEGADGFPQNFMLTTIRSVIQVWHHPGLFPSEPIFVPSPDAMEEDNGVILSVVITPTQEKSTFLLVLDAKTFEELSRAEVPINIPYGFH
ncbi:carotenoid-cleaving dioxygenase, mitochondrial-like [Anguilla rostrata]|uniref:carotenoid-cleaving dioxygenase, mitochondrial-like n=1 Tax=Anguilla rostrata TaxID=7938 RepID=UPI0030D0BD75